jgi:DNA-binding transcriptional regulator YdaS (Cro superfamily)
VASLEAGANDAELHLRVVTDLARLLGVVPAELFARGTDQPAVPTRDTQAVEAALAITRSATSATDLARALGWDLARVRQAVQQLEARQKDFRRPPS